VPELQDPLGGDVVGQLEQLGEVAPELLAHAVGQAHALALQLLGQAGPLAQLDDGRVGGPHGPEQVRVGAQPGGRDAGVAPVVLRAGDAGAVAQPVELLRVDRAHGEAAVEERVDHRPMGHLDRHRDRRRVARGRRQPGAERRQARAAVREGPLADDVSGVVEEAGLVALRAPVNGGEPAHVVIGHHPRPPVQREPPRRLPGPVWALGGATSYRASAVADPPGHGSRAGARGTSA
jgi:hypothetical protein